jgi:hypothetical protein
LKGNGILPRQVKMNSLRRLLRNVPVLRFGAAATLAVLIATCALMAGSNTEAAL